ncbi:MAG: hypothetical protein HC780_23425, partial [Leptolyngbyaceae cyanobacterium CSU_1_3]|nr:hypothetical protein [Leptolyngbyaceae cyanobacterium CSU_1_3]
MKAKWRCLTLGVWGLFILLPGAAAHDLSIAGSSRGLSAAQAQRISRDLIPSSSEDFFRKGREQFEQELKRLSQERPSEPVLKEATQPSLEPRSLTPHDRSYTASAYRFWFRRGVGAAPPARVPPLHPVQNL